jgi:hypothetical protein
VTLARLRLTPQNPDLVTARVWTGFVIMRVGMFMTAHDVEVVTTSRRPSESRRGMTGSPLWSKKSSPFHSPAFRWEAVMSKLKRLLKQRIRYSRFP